MLPIKRKPVCNYSSCCFWKTRFSSKFKGVFGAAKIKDLLNPRFQSINAFTNNIQGLIQNNYEFAKQLALFEKSQNLLENNTFKQQTKEGLIQLKNEGWLSEKEQQTFKPSNILTINIALVR
jgi:hypothetical protein